MKLLHVSSGNLYGGVETMLAALARYRDVSPGLIQHFALCFDGRIANDLRREGLDPVLLGAVRMRRPWSVLAARRRLVELIEHGNYDLVVCHSTWAVGVFGSAVRRSRAALGVWQHHPLTGTRSRFTLGRKSVPDLIICNSSFTAESAARHYPKVPSEVIYCPVPPPPEFSLEDRAEIRGELGTAADATVIVQASRMESWKGHETLLRALATLVRTPGWICWIAGGAQRPDERVYLESIRSLAAELGISERIRFLGERSDIPRVLTAADIYCQPNSGAEPFGIAFVEALAAGIPCVTSALGGALEIVDEKCGELVPPSDVPALGAALRRMIDDPERRLRMGEVGRARAHSLCAPEDRVAQLERFVGEVIDIRGAGALLATTPRAKDT